MPKLEQMIRALLTEAIEEAKVEERARIKKILDEEMNSHSLVQNFVDKYKEVFDA